MCNICDLALCKLLAQLKSIAHNYSAILFLNTAVLLHLREVQ